MPLANHKAGGGANADGSKSETYCSFCYQNGAFTRPNFTAKQMQDFCVEQLSKQAMPKVMAWLITCSIPKLERWRMG